MSSSTKAILSKNSTMNNNDRKRPISSSMRLSPSQTAAKRRGLSSPSSMSRKSANHHSHRSEHDERILTKTNDPSDRQSRGKQQQQQQQQQYRLLASPTPSSEESSRSSSASAHPIKRDHINPDYSPANASRPLHDSHRTSMERKQQTSAQEYLPMQNAHLNSVDHSHKPSDRQKEAMLTKKVASISLLVKPSTPAADQRPPSTICDSDEEYERVKHSSNNSAVKNKSAHVVVPSTVMTIVTASDLSKKAARAENNVIIQQSDGIINPNNSAKLVKLVAPPSNYLSPASSIKMLSSGDGLASALRVPTKIQLTKPPFVPPAHREKSSSFISTVSSHSINQEQSTLSPLSTTLLDIPVDMTGKQQQQQQQRAQQQQAVADYHPSTALPPTPPPPIIDQTHVHLRTAYSHLSNGINQQEHSQKIDTTVNNQESGSSNSNGHGKHSSTSKRHSSHNDHASTASDWSVPPTIELSPTSITSSSPDLSQNPLPADDSLVELELMNHGKLSLLSPSRQYRSLSSSCSLLPSLTVCCSEPNEFLAKPLKSKSLSRLSNGSTVKSSSNNQKRYLTTSSVSKVSSSPRLRRRRREHENMVAHHQNGNGRQLKPKDDYYYPVIKGLLNEMIDRITSSNDLVDNSLKSLLITPVPQYNHPLPFDLLSHRRAMMHSPESTKTEVISSRTTSVTKKRPSLSQSLDLRSQSESRSMVITPKDLDELAYQLHANQYRADHEGSDNPVDAEQRARESWFQMSSQKKNVYYKRVIQTHKRPNCDVVIASSSVTCEKNPLSTNENTDNTQSSSINIAPLLVDLQRQTSTPLSFHSIAPSTPDEQPALSPQDTSSKTTIFADIVNELIKGAKGLDKLSCTPVAFTNSIHNFVRSSFDKQTQTVRNLERQVEKKCPSQLNRATIFWSQKISYFATKHAIETPSEAMNELTLIVKYFYLLVLSLNCRKQEADLESLFSDLLNGKLSFNESFSSVKLTSIIEDLILRSSLADDYLASQPLMISEIDHSLPFVRNLDLETDLLTRNDAYSMANPFSSANDLEQYLNHCEHMTTTNTAPVASYSVPQPHHSSMYYGGYHHPAQCFYRPPPPPPPSDMNNYYYGPPAGYVNSPQMYPYNHPAAYYHSPAVPYGSADQFQNYYYQSHSSPTVYAPSPNSNMDIPLAHNSSHHRTYRQMSANMPPRKYSTSQQPSAAGQAPPTPGPPTTPAVFDTTTVVSPQSTSAAPTDPQV